MDERRDYIGDLIGVTYIPPRDKHMRWHHHTCPDGTEVRVFAQRIAVTNTVLHRWLINGEYVGSNPARTSVDEPPSWTVIDAEHSKQEGKAA